MTSYASLPNKLISAPNGVGLILPRPGDEPAWFADNAAALDGIQGTGL
jgi:hypothetical protein